MLDRKWWTGIGFVAILGMTHARGDNIAAGCWTPDALRGTLADRKIYLNLNPVHTPPARTRPQHSLVPLPKNLPALFVM